MANLFPRMPMALKIFPLLARHTALRFLILSLILSMLALPAFAQFYTVETRNLEIFYYDKSHSYVIPHLTRCLENSLGFYRNHFDYKPSEKVVVLLEDFDDYGYAGAISIPFNYVQLGIEPYKYVFETAPTNERFNWVGNHELAHIVASDKSSKTDRFFRNLFFGKVSPTARDPITLFYSYLTSPRIYSPRWYHEGIAVFLETWMSGGIGRVLGGYDEMVFRSMVRDSSYFYDVVGLESEGTTIDFQVGANSYLYGTRFMSYLAYRYGPDKLLEWYNRTDETKAFFASQFVQVYGVSLDDQWSRWIEWEHEWQQANLDSIRLYPPTPSRALSRTALGSVSKAYFDPNRRKIYAAISYPGQLAHVAAIDINSGGIEKLCDVSGPTLYLVASLAYDQSADALLFTTNNSHSWRSLSVVDIKTGKERQLIKNARVGDLVINPVDRSLWGVQHFKGLSKLVRIPPPYTEWHEVLSLDYGKDLFDIDISPDGMYLTGSFLEISGRQTLIRMKIENLLRGDGSYEILIEFENNTSPENFIFSSDGKYVFGTSYYSGVSNVYRYEFATKKLEAISNSETGFFRPVPVSDDSLVVFQYTGKGFIPIMISNTPIEDVSAIRYLGQGIIERYPELQSWTLKSPLTVNADSVTVRSGEYNGLQHLRFGSSYPILHGFKDFPAYGVQWNFIDPLQLYNVDLTLSYTPNTPLPENQRFHGALGFDHWPWSVRATYNRADFYDLFGPTKTSRKGYSLTVAYSDYLLFDKPRALEYKIEVAGFGGLERLPEYQNVFASFDKSFNAKANLHYEHVVKSLGAVEAEEGITWEVNSYNNFVRSKVFPRVFASLDYGFLLPIDHSSLWFRTSAGYSFGDRGEPFANFYFGGFGNNWVDNAEVSRYREYYSFPGIELNAAGGTNYGKLLVEWTLPPVRFRSFGIPSLYCTWSRIALFSSVIMTNVDSRRDKSSLFDVGAQVDFKLVLFSRLASTFSLGYAAAVEKDQRLSKEFMISLKIF